MNFLIYLLLILVVLFVLKIKANIISKKIIIVYSVWTLTIIGLSMLNFYGLFNVSNYIYFLWIISIIITIVGILFFTKYYKEEKLAEFRNTVGSITNRLINSKALLIISIILCLFFVYYKYRYSSITADMSTETLRIARYDELFSSGIEMILYNYVFVNILKCMLMIMAVLMVFKKFKNRIFILTLFNLILYVSIGYGRMIIFQLIMYYMLSSLILSDKRRKIKLKNVLLLLVAGIVILLIGAIIIVIRLKGIEELTINNIFEFGINEQFQQIYIYFTGGFRMLEKYIKSGLYNVNNFTITRLTFGGIEDILALFIGKIGISFTSINAIVGPATQEIVNIGSSVYMNAFYTCVMNFYNDLGVIGIVIYSLLHSFLISYTINNFIKKKDIVSYILMMYVFSNLLSSIYRWNYQSGSTMIGLIFLIIFDRMYSKKRE